MFVKSVFVCSIASSALAASLPRDHSLKPISAPVLDTTGSSPCATLSASYKSQIAHAPNVKPSFLPSVVHQCLLDVKIEDNDVEVAYVDYINALVQFQSTLSYLKSPPPAYQLPAVDVLGGLDKIKQNAASGTYIRQYDLDLDIYSLFVRARDGHFTYTPNILAFFSFTREESLVSVSADGVALPEVYFQSDLEALANGKAANSSAIVSIDGIDVTDAIINNSERGFQDYDAMYNNQLINPAATGSGPDDWSLTQSATKYQDFTSYTFANGSTIVRRNYMTTVTTELKIDFDSGRKFYSKYILPTPTTASESSSQASSRTSQASGTSSAAPSSSPRIPGAPDPVVQAEYLAGYFLAGPEVSDVAVLKIPSFDPNDDATAAFEFQSSLRQFLRKSKDKKRLIIDVRGNPGGVIYLAYDAFRQLFPQLGTPYSGTRFRAQPLVDTIGQQATKAYPYFRANAETVINPSSTLEQNTTVELAALGGSTFDANFHLTSPDGSPLTSWADLYGPRQVHGGNVSNISAYRLKDPQISAASDHIIISGYGNDSNIPPSPFDPSNITILTDGVCSSTCTTLTNLLTRQAHVKSVVVGGRPVNAPMALNGGVQGNQALASKEIIKDATLAMQAAMALEGPDSAESEATNKTLGIIAGPAPLQVLSVGVNYLDAIAEGDQSETPLQFTYTPADCRTFYTAKDLSDVSEFWSRVAKGVASSGAGFCLNGTVAAWTNASNSTPTNSTTTNSTVTTPTTPMTTTSAASAGVQWSFAAAISAVVGLMFLL